MSSPISSQNLYGPEANASEQSRMELQARLNGLGGLHGRQLSPEAKAAKLRDACEGFESIFIQKMWQEMRNAVPKTGILTGREERFWQDMYDQELSKSMTKAGGIGLADMMYEQLSRNLVSASRSATGAAQSGAFTPGAAPLVPQAGEDLIDPPSLRAEAIYEQAAAAPAANAPGSVPTAVAAAPNLGTQQPVAPAAAPITPAQPLVADVYTAAPNTAHKSAPDAHRAADLNQASGLAMAQQAFRDAGDKLASGAVRPSRQPRPVAKTRQPAEQPAVVNASQSAVAGAGQQIGVINQNGLVPGSPEALRAALDNARTGAVPDVAQQPLNLRNIVAQAQNQNLAAQAQSQFGQAQPQAIAPQQPGQATEETPTLVRVRRTTNIPQKANANKGIKRQSQAIRMLNVENVGVNSRQGQGLNAYHAQQELAAQLNGAQPVPAPLAPLNAASQPARETAQGSPAAIPPLTASDASS